MNSFIALARSPALPRVSATRARLAHSLCPSLKPLMRGRRRFGFTITEAVVVALSISVVLFFVVLATRPSLGRSREAANRIKCGSNLRQIGQAVRIYAIDNGGHFPRTTYDPADPAPTGFTGATAADPFGSAGPQSNDVTAAFWLLLRNTDLVHETFLCPTDRIATEIDFGDFGAADKFGMSNFPSRRYLSFSFANPYPSAEAAEDGWEWTVNLPADFVLAGDLNPGTALAATTQASNRQMRAFNSPNHDREGQNLLYADGSVRFTTTPFEGVRRDNIYTAGGPDPVQPFPSSGGTAVVAPPRVRFDTVLLPTADAFGTAPSASSSQKYWLMIGIPGILLGAAVVVTVAVLANRARRGKLERGELPEMPE